MYRVTLIGDADFLLPTARFPPSDRQTGRNDRQESARSYRSYHRHHRFAQTNRETDLVRARIADADFLLPTARFPPVDRQVSRFPPSDCQTGRNDRQRSARSYNCTIANHRHHRFAQRSNHCHRFAQTNRETDLVRGEGRGVRDPSFQLFRHPS